MALQKSPITPLRGNTSNSCGRLETSPTSTEKKDCVPKRGFGIRSVTAMNVSQGDGLIVAMITRRATRMSIALDVEDI
jgi:hypothetical protein